MLTNGIKSILSRAVHCDGSNDEISTLPIQISTAENKSRLISILEDIFEYQKIFKYSSGYMTGVHLNYNIQAFDRDRMKGILWVYLKCNDLISTISGRYNSGQNLVDYRGLVGDILGKLNDAELLEYFMSSKDNLLELLERPENSNIFNNFNIAYRHRNTDALNSVSPRIEFRWFQNTLNPDDVLVYIELVEAMSAYGTNTQHSVMNTVSFVNFIYNNFESYPYLNKKLSTIYPTLTRARV